MSTGRPGPASSYRDAQERRKRYGHPETYDANLLIATDPDGQEVQPSQSQMASNRGGRPSKLSSERRRVIIESLTAGASLSRAASGAHISDRTIFRWKARGAQEPDGIYHCFVEDIEQVFARRHTPQTDLSPMQVELIALLERAMAATPWHDRRPFEEELIQVLAQKPVMPPMARGREGEHKILGYRQGA